MKHLHQGTLLMFERHCLSLANAAWIPAVGQDMVMVYLEQVADGLGHDAEKLGQMLIRQ